MKSFLIPSLLLLATLCFGQTVQGDFDLVNYPEISFVWNEYNPEIKDSTQFEITRGNEKTPFQLQHTLLNETDSKAKTILFLWEDSNHAQHAGQSDYTRTVLRNFLKDSLLNKQDKFNIAIFDRKGGNDLGTSIHTMLSENFTSDRNQLVEAVQNFKSKYDFFSKQVNSELYMAIEEGIDALQKEPSDRIRAIVVFTAGSNQDGYGGRNSIDENRALSLKIPVYVMKYPIKGCEHCSNIDVISSKTYGRTMTTNDVAIASELLKSCYNQIGPRHYGQDYRILFRSDYPRDGQQHAYVLNVGGKEYPISFTVPAFSLKQWIKGHVLWSVIVGIALLLIVVLMALFINRAVKRRRIEIQSLQLKQQEIRDETDANRQALEDYRSENSRKEREDKELQFIAAMQEKKHTPCLQYSVNGKTIVFPINKPETSIGRDADNDLVLQSDSVSRHHAKMIFNGDDFEIHDLGSTNRVIVNGAFVKQKTLDNGAIIGLGEEIIYFYL